MGEQVGVCPHPLHTHTLQMRPFLILIRVTLPAWLTCGHTAVQPETLSLLAWALSLACGSSTSGLSVLQGATVPLAVQKNHWCCCTVPFVLASGARTPTIFGTCDHISAVHVEFTGFVNHPLVGHARVW